MIRIYDPTESNSTHLLNQVHLLYITFHYTNISMAKKHKPLRFNTKPPNPIHPSLASSSRNRSPSRLERPVDNSFANLVNDEIQRLRQIHARALHREMGSRHARIRMEELSSNTPPPRREINCTRRVRGPAGPPPPKSWLNTGLSTSVQNDTPSVQEPGFPERIPYERIELLPGLYLPEEHSLMSQTLKAIAKNWDWHLEYDLLCLSSVPTRYRMALLCFIARYSPHGVSQFSLDALFMDHTISENNTNNDDLTHLELSMSIGQSLTLKELKEVLTKIPELPTEKVSADPKNKKLAKKMNLVVPDSWDASSPSLPARLTVSRFPSLTHLSLSHPLHANWKSLLGVVQNLATITHLSLAYWPRPSIEPYLEAETATPIGYVNYGGPAFDLIPDSYWAEAAAVLRQLSKKTYCLKWLDLTGCCSWIWALQNESGIDWSGAWRGVETVKVGQGWIPQCLEEHDKDTLLRDLNLKSTKTGKMNPSVFGFENRNAPGALAYWIRYERKIGKVRDIVNVRKSMDAKMKAGKLAARGPSVDELIFSHGEFDGWWGPYPDSVPWPAVSHDDGRGHRVTFERGWEGPWIRAAIENHSPLITGSDTVCLYISFSDLG